MPVWCSKWSELSDLKNPPYPQTRGYNFHPLKTHLAMTDEGAHFVWEDWIGAIGDENIRPNDGVSAVQCQGPNLCSL